MIDLKSGPKRVRRRGESGQALIMFVLGLGVLFGMIAMTVDVGLILHERRSLQNAADAAALAGAVELPASQVLAGSKAQEWAENNGIDLAAGDEIEITVSPNHTSVTVKVTREAPFIFARVLGLTTVDVHASATASIGAPASLVGVMPFGVLKSAIKYDGTPTTIKYDAKDSTKGNFGPLAIDGPGASIYKQGLMYGSETAACAASQPTCADPTSDTEPGNMTGPTRTGMEYRFKNTSSECDEFSEVLIDDGDGSYSVSGSCNPWTEGSSSLLLVLIPVIDAFPPGRSKPVTIEYFAAFFINEMSEAGCSGDSCQITGTFVKTVVDPTSDATLGIYNEDSGVKFVRLVE